MEKNKDVAGTSSCPGEIYFADSARGRIVFAEGKGKNRNDPQFPMESEKGKWKGMSKGGLTTTRHDYSLSLFPFFLFFFLSQKDAESLSLLYIYIYTCTNSRQFGRYLRAFLPQMLFIDEKRKESGKERERDRSFVFKHAVKN